MIYIADENVPLTANDLNRTPSKTPQADIKCKIACVDALLEMVDGVVALDIDGEILTKYRSKLSLSGMPGTGDAFLKHLSDHQGDPKRVKKFALLKEEDGGFSDFPTDEALESFDSDDRIFVALAVAATAENPKIFNAVDSDYKHHEDALKAAGIKVHELCPHCLKEAQ